MYHCVCIFFPTNVTPKHKRHGLLAGKLPEGKSIKSGSKCSFLTSCPKGRQRSPCNWRTAWATETWVRSRQCHLALRNTVLSIRSERLTRPTLNFVPKGDVIRKQACFAYRENSSCFFWEAERKSVSMRYGLRQKKMRQRRWKTNDFGRILQNTECTLFLLPWRIWWAPNNASSW